MKWMKLLLFIQLNHEVLAGMILGAIAGYFYWTRFGMMWGTYPLSSECWVNCTYGCLFGGFIANLISEPWPDANG
ncbi:MAG: hypothetical protein LBJ23_04155 [Tannerella sp.]|jgi:hypothetical protein|nr:hypothetical protein [Tannerella sp.]